MNVTKIHLKDRFAFLGENGRDPVLDMILPYNSVEMGRQNMKRPCIVVCPGGGYAFCSEREAEPIGVRFLPLGYNIFILNYSVAPHRYPNQLREVAAVMELIYQNADEWHCDTDRIAIIGFSAGGHLAAHYTNAYDCADVREVFPESKPVNASMLCYPVISADKTYAHIGSFQNLLGKQEITAEDVERYSCDRLVSDKTPPTFIWATAEDNAVPVKNSLVYAEALANHKVPFEMHVYPFGHHGLSTVDDQTCGPVDEKTARVNNWLAAATSWIKLIFGNIG